ncbi:MAG: TolC family protein [Planctomycetota bacterium]
MVNPSLRAGLLVLVAFLPSCVAAIGNTGGGISMRAESLPFLEERISSAERIVQIRERALGQLQSEFEAGRGSVGDLAEAEIAVEEARIRLSMFRAEAAGVRGRKKD